MISFCTFANISSHPIIFLIFLLVFQKRLQVLSNCFCVFDQAETIVLALDQQALISLDQNRWRWQSLVQKSFVNLDKCILKHSNATSTDRGFDQDYQE